MYVYTEYGVLHPTTTSTENHRISYCGRAVRSILALRRACVRGINADRNRNSDGHAQHALRRLRSTKVRCHTSYGVQWVYGVQSTDMQASMNGMHTSYLMHMPYSKRKEGRRAEGKPHRPIGVGVMQAAARSSPQCRCTADWFA